MVKTVHIYCDLPYPLKYLRILYVATTISTTKHAVIIMSSQLWKTNKQLPFVLFMSIILDCCIMNCNTCASGLKVNHTHYSRYADLNESKVSLTIFFIVL